MWWHTLTLRVHRAVRWCLQTTPALVSQQSCSKAPHTHTTSMAQRPQAFWSSQTAVRVEDRVKARLFTWMVLMCQGWRKRWAHGGKMSGMECFSFWIIHFTYNTTATSWKKKVHRREQIRASDHAGCFCFCCRSFICLLPAILKKTLL